MAQPIASSEHQSQDHIADWLQNHVRQGFARHIGPSMLRCSRPSKVVEADYGSTGKWSSAIDLDSTNSCFVIRLTAIPALPHDAMSSHRSGSRCENPAKKIKKQVGVTCIHIDLQRAP